MVADVRNLSYASSVGFKDIKKATIDALQAGNVQHEARAGAIDDKNLLQTGDVTTQDVMRLLARCKGTQYSSAPHHQTHLNIEVHIFQPEMALASGQEKRRWYIKLYLLESDIWFISVH